MGSVWLHVICAACWNERHPDRQVAPVAGGERCCFCGERHAAGIYLRENPAHLACQGRHQAGEYGRACWHEPADPSAADTICWHCGAIIKRAWREGEWKRAERSMRPPGERHAS